MGFRELNITIADTWEKARGTVRYQNSILKCIPEKMEDSTYWPAVLFT